MKASIQLKKIASRESQGACCQDELIGGLLIKSIKSFAFTLPVPLYLFAYYNQRLVSVYYGSRKMQCLHNKVLIKKGC
jgi:hypothetical protein